MRVRLRKFLLKNQDVFAPKPRTPGPANVQPHYIETLPDARPVRVNLLECPTMLGKL